MPTCPLCHTADVAGHHADRARRYFRCAACALVFLDPALRPTREDELARYRLHDNRADDPRYREFLMRLAAPVIARTSPGARGLDVGCGPMPLLGTILSESGRPTAAYDPFFFPDRALLAGRYDFVTCSETVEHAHDPGALFDQLGACTRPGGIIGVMTQWTDDAGPFGEWWYRRDPTHVCFFSRATMEFVARARGWSVALPAASIALFTTA